MTSNDRLNHLIALDEELLKGGVVLSEWCRFIVREADAAFSSGAHLASILVAVSGVETYLRAEYSNGKRERLATLIDASPIDLILKQDLHTLRKYRNNWVHVDDPWNDGALLEKPEETENELEEMAFFAVSALRRTIYENQWI
jgi:hypothetical protein